MTKAKEQLMFDHTQAAFRSVIDGFKRMIFIIALITQIVIIGQLGYSIYTDKGNLIANVVLITLSVAYLIFFIVTRNKNSRKEKAIKKATKRTVTYLKLLVNAATLGTVLYSAVIVAADMGAIDIVLIALSLIGWILQVAIQLIILFIEAQKNLIKTAVEMDLEIIKKPVDAVGGVIKKITGKDDGTAATAQVPTNERTRKKLSKLRDAFRKERADLGLLKKLKSKKKASDTLADANTNAKAETAPEAVKEPANTK